MNSETLLDLTRAFVKKQLASAEGGHDWFHVERVYNNAVRIAQTETVNLQIVQLAALLHDIADSKFHDGDETIGPKKAETFMRTQGVSEEIRNQVVYIIRNMSFKNSFDDQLIHETIELQVVRDADRLDAIGAIGIARAFNYGGFKGRPLYDPDIPANLQMSKETYKKSNGPTINHFYEKLLLLKDLMHTQTGKHLAERRHQFMLDYLNKFYQEWDESAN
ncbi:MAG: hypothetical protein RLZZ241_32 [Bacteroidota bacterium]|jgi:uncharacterized protein